MEDLEEHLIDLYKDLSSGVIPAFASIPNSSWRDLGSGSARVTRAGEGFWRSRTFLRLAILLHVETRGEACFGATPKVRAGLALARVTPAPGGQAVRYPIPCRSASTATALLDQTEQRFGHFLLTPEQIGQQKVEDGQASPEEQHRPSHQQDHE